MRFSKEAIMAVATATAFKSAIAAPTNEAPTKVQPKGLIGSDLPALKNNRFMRDYVDCSDVAPKNCTETPDQKNLFTKS